MSFHFLVVRLLVFSDVSRSESQRILSFHVMPVSALSNLCTCESNLNVAFFGFLSNPRSLLFPLF